jgi:hypothetical protein
VAKMFKMIPIRNENMRLTKKKLKDFEIQSKRDCDNDPVEPPMVTDLQKNSVYNVDCIPKGMDIFWSDWRTFLPEGKDPEDLTPEEKKKLTHQYRYSPLRPGIYQGVTGINNGARSNRGNMYT